MPESLAPLPSRRWCAARRITVIAVVATVLPKVGYTGFAAANMYTKWTGKGASRQPSYVKCATAKCSTIEFKSQTRAFKQTSAGGRYTILANFGDQFSDLIGGSAVVPVKLPNPTYYLP